MTYLEIIGSLIAVQTSYLAYKAFGPATRLQKASLPKIVCDTSALIDGRIVAIARSGFLSAEIIIPRSVVRELQYMADRADHDKRERARYGLDVVKELQDIAHISVTNYDDGIVHNDGVDEQLMVIAKKLGARLCTTDYNLNKVARTEQITVVNVNELAHALRPMHLPGEIISVGIVAPGQNKDQGVGYLDDGTMVVVDRAKSAIGQTIEAETTRVIQTEAGRMVFARTASSPARPVPQRSTTRPQYRKSSHAPRPPKPTSREDALIDLANR
ncbi:MAG: hypothetical protein WBB39_00410 [Candidatus Saccharimonadales bacterium]